jgi:hypothetical protein
VELKLDEATYAKIVEAARQAGVSPAELIDRAIRNFVRDTPREAEATATE